MTGKNRRKEPRYEVKTAVSVATHGSDFNKAFATDISGGGIGIRSSKAILPGTKVTIIMQLGEQIEFRGTVVWTLDTFDNGKTIYKMGITTDTIISSKIKAQEPHERTKLIEEILDRMDKTKVV